MSYLGNPEYTELLIRNNQYCKVSTDRSTNSTVQSETTSEAKEREHEIDILSSSGDEIILPSRSISTMTDVISEDNESEQRT